MSFPGRAGRGGATGAGVQTNGGAGGNGGIAYGGGLSYVIPVASSNTGTNTISLTFAPFTDDSVTTGAGGAGGVGAPYGSGGSALEGRGGAIAILDNVGTTVLGVNSSTFNGNAVIGGAGGAGLAVGGTGNGRSGPRRGS